MNAEDEEFNRIEMESRIRQEYVRSMKQETVPLDAVLEMRDYIRQLQGELRNAQTRVAVLENGICQRAFERKWAGLSDTEFETLVAEAGFTRSDVLMNGSCIERLVDLVETRLKEKNT